jgi:hypothetical protein
MESDVWAKEVAHRYLHLPEPAQAETWRKLSPDQQNTLRNALTELHSATPRPGNQTGTGCIAMICGFIVTVLIEAFLIVMIYQAMISWYSKRPPPRPVSALQGPGIEGSPRW